MNKQFPCSNKSYLAILIFFVTILILGLPFTKWGFKTDDFGNIYHSQLSSLADVKKVFRYGNIEALYYPSDYQNKDQAFFCGLFRPMSFIYYAPQYHLFKTNTYGYYFVTIAFHALNSMFFFLLLSYFLSNLAAFMASLFFAFHPSLWNWLGWVSAQTYYIELFTLFLLIFSLKKFLESGNLGYYILSCLCFASNLFLKEATIILPIWIVLAVVLYKTYLQEHTPSIKLFFKGLAISSGYWIIAAFYSIIRLSMFPLTSNTSTLTFKPTLASFIARQKERIFDFVTYVADIIGLNWMPPNNQLLKGTIIASVFFCITYLFFKSTKKSLLLFLAFSTALFSWPALLMHYQPRYIYMSLPFFILLVVCSFKFQQKSVLKKYHSLNFSFISILILCNGIFLTRGLKQREQIFYSVTKSFNDLLQNSIIHDRPLCFLGLPTQWFHMGTAQAIWFLSKNDTYPIYQYGPKIVLKDKEHYLAKPAFDKNYLEIIRKQNTLIFKTTNKNKLWFTSNGKKLSVSSITIAQKHVDNNTVFITWDYQKAHFKIL